MQQDSCHSSRPAPKSGVPMDLPRIQAFSSGSLDSSSARTLRQLGWWAECAVTGWPSNERFLVDWSGDFGYLFYLPDSQVFLLIQCPTLLLIKSKSIAKRRAAGNSARRGTTGAGKEKLVHCKSTHPQNDGKCRWQTWSHTKKTHLFWDGVLTLKLVDQS